VKFPVVTPIASQPPVSGECRVGMAFRLNGSSNNRPRTFWIDMPQIEQAPATSTILGGNCRPAGTFDVTCDVGDKWSHIFWFTPELGGYLLAFDMFSLPQDTKLYIRSYELGDVSARLYWDFGCRGTLSSVSTGGGTATVTANEQIFTPDMIGEILTFKTQDNNVNWGRFFRYRIEGYISDTAVTVDDDDAELTGSGDVVADNIISVRRPRFVLELDDGALSEIIYSGRQPMSEGSPIGFAVCLGRESDYKVRAFLVNGCAVQAFTQDGAAEGSSNEYPDLGNGCLMVRCGDPSNDPTAGYPGSYALDRMYGYLDDDEVASELSLIRTIYVPDDYPTIQEALFAAHNGDTIVVRDGVWTGTYNKNIDFGGLAVTVRSENGPENCAIDCEGDGRGFYFRFDEGPDSVVDGFTITNGYLEGNNSGGGILCEESSPTITNCTITGNSAVGYDGYGGGIAFGNASPSIANCIITGNTARNGGAAFCFSAANATLTNCTITGNTANRGGGVFCEDSSPRLVNCILWNDGPQEIYVYSGSPPIVTYCDVQGGWPGDGNIDADPFFVDPDNDDYHLSSDSPCINTGSIYAPALPDEDIEGNPRIQYCRVDMGAYESPYAGTFEDCNENNVEDDCDIYEGTSPDCNQNHVPDECDIADGTSDDYDLNGVPDECEDCNQNGIPDACDIDCGTGNCGDHPLGCGGSEDCNTNGVPDECDIAEGTSHDVNDNGVPDECECEADINGDGSTDQVDLAFLLAWWGKCEGEPGYDPAGDLNGDGCINHADLGILLADWGCGT